MANKTVTMSVDVHLKDLNEIDFLVGVMKNIINDERIDTEVRNEYARKINVFYNNEETHNPNADEIDYTVKER